MATSFNISDQNDNVNIYECEVRLKFRIIEDQVAIDERDNRDRKSTRLNSSH